MNEDWIPQAGLSAFSGMSNRELAAALEVIRKSRCGYVGPTSDCKRGIAGRLIDIPEHPNWHKNHEATGCYELRVAIHRLLDEDTNGTA